MQNYSSKVSPSSRIRLWRMRDLLKRFLTLFEMTLSRFPIKSGMTLMLLSIFYLVLAARSNVSAQELSFSLYPPHLELITMPGKSIVTTYKLQNLGDPVVARVNVLPFIPKEDGGATMQDEFSGPVRFSLDNSGVQLGEPFFVNTKQSLQLLLRIRIPEGAPEGDYYYTFFLENEPSPPAEGKEPAPRVQGKIGSHLLITVTKEGVLETKGKVTLFDFLSGFKLGDVRVFDSGEKIPVVLIIRNEGKNFIQSQGQIVLKGNFGEKATYDLKPSNILAESQRVMTVNKPTKLDCKEDKEAFCRRPVTLLLSGFFIGKYDLSTSINFGEGTPQLSSSTTFIAIPIKFLLGLLGVLIVGLILGKKFKT